MDERTSLLCFPFIAALGLAVWIAGDPGHRAAAFQARTSYSPRSPGDRMARSLVKPGQQRAATAKRHNDVVRAATTLGGRLANIEQFILGTSTTGPQLCEPSRGEQVVAQILAVLERSGPERTQRNDGVGGSGPSANRDLKTTPPLGQVTAIDYCGGVYTVQTADGSVSKIREFNLRLETDSSDLGPRTGQPVIVGAGTPADRASVVFSEPSEISSFINDACPLGGDDAAF